jgi:hypothetical protein
MLNNFFFENYATYKVTLKNIVNPDRLQMTIRRMRIACWILKAANTHSEYVLIIAFPLQQWLHESATMLRYTLLSVFQFIRITLLLVVYTDGIGGV